LKPGGVKPELILRLWAAEDASPTQEDLMASTAQSAIPSSISPDLLLQSADVCRSSETSDEIRGIIDAPGDPQRVTAFIRSLERLDPSEPRSDELTTALMIALSAVEGDARVLETFVLHSLHADIRSSCDRSTEEIELDPSKLALIAAFLARGRTGSLLLENCFISLRRRLLDFAVTGQTPSSNWLDLAEAMARQCFLNEFIWDQSEAEQKRLDDLTATVAHAIAAGEAVSAFHLFVLGAYRPLFSVDPVREWVRALARRDLGALDPTLRLLVLDRLIEDETEIEAITPITSSVSQSVRSQYEANPYPRWLGLPTINVAARLPAYVAAGVGHSTSFSPINPARPKVLIAGAGTGKHPICVARTMPGAGVLAIDLSRASLAYARRQAAVHRVQNVSFAQADILKLSGVDEEFDLIEACGVLHHMEDPEAGLQTLLKALKPGGYIRVALYSKIARKGVTAAREAFAASDYGSDLAAIRAFRRDLIQSDDPMISSLQLSHDFYASSEFRDLVMHVQEHQFTIPEIKSMLARNRLKFLGFNGRQVRNALSNMPEKMAKRRLRDLDAWERFERRNPGTFSEMYDFFCVKR
jgi:SAM-dependent methyltransferase